MVSHGLIDNRAADVDHARGKDFMRRFIALHGDAELHQVVDALGSPRGLTRCLDGRQEQRNQYRDDRDHDQQLDQSKPG